MTQHHSSAGSLLAFPSAANDAGVSIAWYRQHFRTCRDPITLAAAGLLLCEDCERRAHMEISQPTICGAIDGLSSA